MSTLDTIEPEQPEQPVVPPALTRYSWESDESWAERCAQTPQRRMEDVERYRAALDVIAETGVPVPSLSGDVDEVRLAWHAYGREEFDSLRKALGSTLDSPWSKGTTDYGSPYVERYVADGVRARLYAGWATCDRVETGVVEEVERYVDSCPTCEADLVELDNGGQACSDESCAYENRPPKRVKRSVEQPVTEWRCSDVADL